ncbi:sialidase family protein [Rhodopirellula sp. SWK7]|uniref:sialidase family protein n=1 Tax=Rhodopirellula sp. SWK7 TaxID=595460 RepID=UPI000345E7BF|nr:sialidase family protein [Rhodopirellula sp. SWK7]
MIRYMKFEMPPSLSRNPIIGPFAIALLVLNLFAVGETYAEARLDQPAMPLFVSGEGGYNTFRIPAIVRTTNDTLLAFAEGRVAGSADHGDVDLVLRRSIDNGATWSDLHVIRDNGKNQAGNPCPLVDRHSGRVYLFFCKSSHSERQVLNGTGSRDVHMMTSDDDGQTWMQPINISEMAKKPNWRWYATGPCSAIQIQTGKYAGRLVLPVNHSIHYSDGRRWEYRCHSLVSDDQGKTWQIGESSAPGGSETQIAEVGPDLLIQDIRMQTHRKGYRAVRFSNDGGLHWSELTHDPSRPCPKCQGTIIAVPGERSRLNRLISANPKGPGRSHLTVYESRDGGEQWRALATITKSPAAYSDLVSISNNQIGCLFETGQESPYERIDFQRFDIE